MFMQLFGAWPVDYMCMLKLKCDDGYLLIISPKSPLSHSIQKAIPYEILWPDWATIGP